MPATKTYNARRMTNAQVTAFFDVLAGAVEPRSELNWTTPLDLLVAVVLSAQATDTSVNAVTPKLWERCRRPEHYLALGEEGVQGFIRTIGLFRNKAKAIVGISRDLIERFDGQIPTTREELESLPGVGRKTANVVLNVAFGEPVVAVDTHVQRVANRTGLVKETTPPATEKALLKRIPPVHLLHAHHYLILHGRYTCKARKPACEACPVREPCGFREKTGSTTKRGRS